jgi:anti-sigma regulatory factor (Ser/Thr protein kinase)
MVQLLNHIKLPAKIENLKKWTQSVLECAGAQKFEGKRIQEIELALEEALVNICHYSYPEKPGEVEINCKIDDSHFIVEMIDSGKPFDVTSLSDPDLTANIDERKMGGLGVFLIKKMVDEVRYRRENDQNILSLIIKKGKR